MQNAYKFACKQGFEGITIQELKLHGRKICDGVVISPYSWVKSFANDPSTLFTWWTTGSVAQS